MRQVAGFVVALALLAVPQAAAKPGVPTQLLAFVGSGRDVAVVKVDALTLKPVSRAAPMGLSNPTFVSRFVGRVAIADGYAALRFLDLDSLRWAGRVTYPGVPAAALWNYADKLVTLHQASTAEVIVVDPTKHRLGAIRNLGGAAVATAVSRDHIVALLAPLDGIGPSRLAVIDDRGRARTTPLPQIRSGSGRTDSGGTWTFVYPALAVDPLGTEAVVVGTDGTIADVNVETLATSFHVARSVASVRKYANGSTRTAEWLGSGIVAVSGGDTAFDGTTQRMTPAGLTFVDTRTWTSRTLDTTSLGATIAVDGYLLLAYGDKTGVTLYDSSGALRGHFLDGTSARPAAVAGAYAYLGGQTHFTIVNTMSGAVVKTVDTAKWTELTSSWSY
jgi:hypothetical protein